MRESTPDQHVWRDDGVDADALERPVLFRRLREAYHMELLVHLQCRQHNTGVLVTRIGDQSSRILDGRACEGVDVLRIAADRLVTGVREPLSFVHLWWKKIDIDSDMFDHLLDRGPGFPDASLQIVKDDHEPPADD